MTDALQITRTTTAVSLVNAGPVGPAGPAGAVGPAGPAGGGPATGITYAPAVPANWSTYGGTPAQVAAALDQLGALRFALTNQGNVFAVDAVQVIEGSTPTAAGLGLRVAADAFYRTLLIPSILGFGPGNAIYDASIQRAGIGVLAVYADLFGITPGKIQHADATAANQSATLGQMQAADALAVQTSGGGKELVNTQAAATGAVVLNPVLGNIQNVTLTGNVTFSFLGATNGVGCSMTLIVKQDATGSRTITWPASVKWAGGGVPVASTVANSTDIYTFFTLDGGITWFGNRAGAGYA